MKNEKSILLICSRSVTVVYFRMRLITALMNAGYKVTVAALDRDREAEITATGAAFYSVDGNNRSINPLQQFRQIGTYKRLIEQIKPDIVFTFQAVPNMLGGIAAHQAGVKRLFCMVEGAGDVFVNQGIKWKLVRFVTCLLYKRAFTHACKVFFLNHDDVEEFCCKKLVSHEQCEMIPGIGVDLEKFSYEKIIKDNVFLMVSRMMESKGTLDFCKAARLVRKQYPNAVFRFLGEEFTLKLTDIQSYIDDGSIEYAGYSKDVHAHLAEASVFVLPSFYREGLPMTIMEAMATGRPVITTKTVGCDGSIVEGKNGWYVNMHDPEDLAQKCIYAIEHPAEVREMGKQARDYAENIYDVDKINLSILQKISE